MQHTRSHVDSNYELSGARTGSVQDDYQGSRDDKPVKKKSRTGRLKSFQRRTEPATIFKARTGLGQKHHKINDFLKNMISESAEHKVKLKFITVK